MLSEFSFSGRVQRLLPVTRVHEVGGQSSSRCDIKEELQPSGVNRYPALPTGKRAYDLLSQAVHVLRVSSIGDSSRTTYNVGFNQFCSFLTVAGITVPGISLPQLLSIVCTFAAYLFFFRGLQPSTIRSYILLRCIFILFSRFTTVHNSLVYSVY